MEHALVTVRGASVRWFVAGEVFRSVPWAREVLAATDPDGVRLRFCSEETVLGPGRVLALGGLATVCLRAEPGRDGEVPTLGLGPTLRTRSEAMIRALYMAALAATVQDPVLIVGESGTGKELIAHAIHDLAARAPTGRKVSAPFLAINMGAIPDDLAEAQLFGWVRGAFTGAVESRPGAFEAAGDGSLFLDEVGETSLAIQAKILRAVEARAICRVGSVTEIPVRARLLCATHRDLLSEVAAGRFRLDLYERLACVVVRMPPLRERPEDIPLLASDLASSLPMGPKVEPDAIEVLRGWDWRGNVRSLRNALHRAALLTLGGPISAWAVREALSGEEAPLRPACGEREPRHTRADQIAKSGLPRSTFYYRLRRGRLALPP